MRRLRLEEGGRANKGFRVFHLLRVALGVMSVSGGRSGAGGGERADYRAGCAAVSQCSTPRPAARPLAKQAVSR